jgi:hypothetical protein
MSNLTAKIAPILFAGVAAGAVVVALPARAVHAADNCVTEPPKADAPHGKHWYYRIERGTGHHCWYMRGEDEKSADAPSAAPTEKVASQQPDASSSRSFADARDEVTPRASTANNAAPNNAVTNSTNASPTAAAPSVWPNAVAAAPAAPGDTAATAPASTPDTSPSPVASRWPQASDNAAPAANAAAAANSAPVATAPAAANPPDDTATVADAAPNDAAQVPPAPPPPADLAATPAERQTGSLQTLLLVAFGALALAGFTGSAVYRLGRRSKRNNWLRERNAWQDAQNPHRPPWVDEPRIQPEPAVADLDQEHFDQQHFDQEHFDEPQHIEPQSGFSLAADETSLDEIGPGSERIEKIEDFLARLTQQLHEELDATRPRSA